MSDSSVERTPFVGGSHASPWALYYWVFAIVFVFAFLAACVSRLAGKTGDSVLTEARQSAGAAAGYAIKY